MSRITTRERLCIYFTANPDEALTLRDIQVRFDLKSYRKVQETALYMERAGLLSRERHAHEPSMMTAGPELLREISRLRETA